MTKNGMPMELFIQLPASMIAHKFKFYIKESLKTKITCGFCCHAQENKKIYENMFKNLQNFHQKKKLREVWSIIKGCSHFDWTNYLDMLDVLKEHLKTRNIFFNNADEVRKISEFLDYMFKFYMTFV